MPKLDGRTSRIGQKDRILWVGPDSNMPWREGTDAYKRAKKVKKYSGKTRKFIEKKVHRATTVYTLRRHGLIKVKENAS